MTIRSYIAVLPHRPDQLTSISVHLWYFQVMDIVVAPLVEPFQIKMRGL